MVSGLCLDNLLQLATKFACVNAAMSYTSRLLALLGTK